MFRRLLAISLALGCAGRPSTMTKSTPPSWPTLDATLLADAAATYNFRLGTPTPLAVTADGNVLFRRTGARTFAADLYELDTKTGAIKTLYAVGGGAEHLSDAEKARRERTRTATRGVVDIDVSSDGRLVLVPIGGVFELIDRTQGTRSTIDPGGEAYDAHLSPDGARIGFIRDKDVWTIATSGGGATRLTTHPDGFEYGIADFAAQEELGRTRGWWWSPDSTQIAFQRTDTRPMDTLYVADARHPEKPPVPFKYPRAGRANAIVDLGIVAATGGTPRWLTWDLARYPYLARVAWRAAGPLSFSVLSREQTDLALYAVEGDRLAELLTEHDEAWINLADGYGFGHTAGTPLWTGPGQFLWQTEGPDGWNLVQQDHTPVAVNVRGLVGIDAGEPITVQSDDVLHSHVMRGSHRITTDEGAITMAGFDHGVLVATTALASGGKRTVAYAHGATFELPSVAETPKLVPTTSLETVTIDGRTHHVAITRPRDFHAGTKYPVILNVYGGPHKRMVDGYRDGYVMDQWYADAGFIVVRSDNRGTPDRGRAWERAILKDLLTVPLDDQVRALQAVGAKYRELDMSRVGITGWSFGGYMAAMAVLLRPDVFKAGVAGAPVTDWLLYDTAYTERYMRLPEHNAEGYKRTSAMTYADRLERPLLVIHGITDDNVHFAHSLALIEELYVHAKRVEVITLSATHMVPDPKLSLAREQTQVDFFRQHL